jgi:hypothetical protein
MALEKHKLDRTRSFGMVYGTPGIAFEQDGVHYSGAEVPVEEWSSPEKIAGEAKLAEKRRQREVKLAEQREMSAIRRKLREDE